MVVVVRRYGDNYQWALLLNLVCLYNKRLGVADSSNNITQFDRDVCQAPNANWVSAYNCSHLSRKTDVRRLQLQFTVSNSCRNVSEVWYDLTQCEMARLRKYQKPYGLPPRPPPEANQPHFLQMRKERGSLMLYVAVMRHLHSISNYTL
jgi:hypothetical protein